MIPSAKLRLTCYYMESKYDTLLTHKSNFLLMS